LPLGRAGSAREVFRHADVPARIALAQFVDLGHTPGVDARELRAILYLLQKKQNRL
jgi:hypothetical protein